MTEVIRLSTVISPDLEERIKTYGLKNEDLEKLLDKIITYYSKEKTALLLLPSSLEEAFYRTKKLRVYRQMLDLEEVGVIIGDFPKTYECSNVLEQETLESKTYIYNKVKNCEIPFVIDNVSGGIKRNCNVTKECNDTFCKSIEEIFYTDISSESFSKTSEDYYKNWVFHKKEINEENIKKFIRVIGRFFEVTEEDLLKLKNINITENYIEELKKHSKKEIKEAIISIARSIFFPSYREKNTKFAIDYHPNNNFTKYNGWNIYRMDCLDLYKTGNTNSGTRRSIFIEKDKVRYYIAYTKNHDIADKIIKNRINKI